MVCNGQQRLWIADMTLRQRSRSKNIIPFHVSANICDGPPIDLPHSRLGQLEISVFRETGLKNVGRLGTHTFVLLLFFREKYNF